jgi:hypothetical protein
LYSNDRLTEKSTTPGAPIFKIYPREMTKVKIAWMSCGNSVGFEIFEFAEPGHVAKEGFEYNRESDPALHFLEF